MVDPVFLNLSFDCFILYLISAATITIFMQEKYEEAIASLAQMEKRVVMAETMLEATLQYQSGQVKAQPSPRYVVNFADKDFFLCAVSSLLLTR